MTFDPKRRFIKDPIWGNIELLPWEVELLNHFLVNRLHNVVQNSSAYKVYPGLKYSRFVHSIGVVHVVTRIFSNAVLNSPHDAVQALKAENDAVAGGLEGDDQTEIAKVVCERVNCSPQFAALLCALRLGAILHDIGHLPYSHVFEHAIEAFLEGHYESGIPLAKPAKQVRQSLNALLAARKTQEVKVHELLGAKFSKLLLEDFVDRPLVKRLVKGAVELLHGSECPIAKSLLVGPLDSDRIDFVRRDGFFSGLLVSSVDYGRLFSMYELAARNGQWYARPSRRGTSEAEKLIWERFQDYRYIVSHHRVHLFDEILERFLLRLMADGSLLPFLKNLEQLLTLQPAQRISGREDRLSLLKSLLLSFDDSWLDVQLRDAYTKAKAKKESHKVALFEAYAEDRDFFRSVFKQDSDFWERCASVAPQLAERKDPYFAIAVTAKKYALEEGIEKKFNVQVVVGETANKIRHGMRDDETADFFGLTELKEFLATKIRQTKLFNVWYAPPADARGGSCRQLEDNILKYIQDEITPQKALDFDKTTEKDRKTA